jgi:hypothetical protein
VEWGADGNVLTCQISLKTTDAALCTGSGHSVSFEDAATNISITKEEEEMAMAVVVVVDLVAVFTRHVTQQANM